MQIKTMTFLMVFIDFQHFQILEKIEMAHVFIPIHFPPKFSFTDTDSCYFVQDCQFGSRICEIIVVDLF